jgi:hypothetical protein
MAGNIRSERVGMLPSEVAMRERRIRRYLASGAMSVTAISKLTGMHKRDIYAIAEKHGIATPKVGSKP